MLQPLLSLRPWAERRAPLHGSASEVHERAYALELCALGVAVQMDGRLDVEQENHIFPFQHYKFGPSRYRAHHHLGVAAGVCKGDNHRFLPRTPAANNAYEKHGRTL